MNIEQFRYLIAIERCGSLNRAATQLSISEPALSMSMKKMEKEMNKTIFVRHRNGVSLTPFGRDLLPYAAETITLYDQMTSHLLMKERNRLFFSVANGNYSFIAKTISQLYYAHQEEGIQIRYLDLSRRESLTLAAEGSIDIGVYRFWDFQRDQTFQKLRRLNLDFVPVCRSPVTVRVSPHNPLYTRTEDWVTKDMIMDFPFFSSTTVVNELHKRLGLRLGKNQIICNNNYGVRAIREQTDFISVSSAIVPASQEALTKEYRTFTLRDADCSNIIGYVFAHTHALSPLALEWIGYYKEVFRNTTCRFDGLSEFAFSPAEAPQPDAES
ncbi:MAG: LysR family transcriptional regulator [Lachnospiraceae bacterium]|nr:LysR family transcriptional regulator [Lachnospiraceae bacterium]